MGNEYYWRSTIVVQKMNKRLVFIVEGDSEVQFVNEKIIPYLYTTLVESNGWTFNAQKITTNKKLNISGGNINFSYLENEVSRVSSQNSPWITTMLDFYKLPPDFPGFTTDGCLICSIENAMADKIGYNRFVPYIQKYEFETLLFADVESFSLLCDEKQMTQLREIKASYQEIESINGGRDTAPSKRLAHIFNYEKTSDSMVILDNIEMQSLIKASPRFGRWIDKIARIVKQEGK